MTIRISFKDTAHSISFGDDSSHSSVYWLSYVKEYYNGMDIVHATMRGWFRYKKFQKPVKLERNQHSDVFPFWQS